MNVAAEEMTIWLDLRFGECFGMVPFLERNGWAVNPHFLLWCFFASWIVKIVVRLSFGRRNSKAIL